MAKLADVIRVRLEAHGARGPAALTFDQPVAGAVECGLLEEGDTPAVVEGNRLNFTMRPFELKTFRVS